MADESLACLNCKAAVPPDKAKMFAEVFLCPVCYAQAAHFHDRLTRELRSLLVLAKDAIRVALLEGRFHFPEQKDTEGVSKREVLEAILEIEERRSSAGK